MVPNPHRDMAAGRAFNDLRNLARREGRSTDELLVFYVLERFLYRVSRSAYADGLVLKGGLLLAVLDARRATRDADLLALDTLGGEDRVVAWVKEIASMPVDDGVTFATEDARSELIRESEIYAGVRVIVPAMVGRARVRLGLDINFGDPVTPGAVRAAFPALLGGAFPLLVYPIETVLAEKLTTALSLGDANTRDRDWADIWRLTGVSDVDGTALLSALRRTGHHRRVQLTALSEAVTRLPDLRKAPYAAWRRRQGVYSVEYPEDFSDLVRSVIGFADPALRGDVEGATWDATLRSWRYD